MGRGGPRMLGHRGVGPSNRDHPDLARVRNPSPRQLPPGLAALGVPTIKARLQKPPPWTALREASKPAQYPPPLSGPRPLPVPGDRVGGSTKTTNRVSGKRAAVSCGRPEGATVPIAPGSARRGPGTASALVTPTG
jgi:hypothetical protein